MSSNSIYTRREDYITLLKVVEPAHGIMAKRLIADGHGGIRKIPVTDGWRFDGMICPLTSIYDLAEIMPHLEKCPQYHAVRGKPLRPEALSYIARRKHPPYEAFEEDSIGHHWIMIDYDEVPCPYFLDPDDRDIALGYLIRLLPKPFWTATYYYQWSSGAGLDQWRTLRCHLWFWLTHPARDHALENWAKWLNYKAEQKIIDPIVYRTVQPLFTAAPVLEGIDDPVGIRSGLVKGVVDHVDLRMPLLDCDTERRRQERAEYDELVDWGLRQPITSHSGTDDGFVDACARIGDGYGYDGLHVPMTKALAAWCAHHGPEDDETVKDIIRQVVDAAPLHVPRDIEYELSDRKLDASLRGAHALCERPKKPRTLLERMRAAKFNLNQKG